MTADGFATSGRSLNVVRAILHKEIVTGATRSAVGVLKDPLVVKWKETGGNIPVDRKTIGILPEPLPKFRLVLDPMYPQLA